MPVDYDRISEENRDRYGWDIERVGRMVLADQYADRAHFIFELLQNAEDALERRGDDWDGDRTISFNLTQDELRVSHCGAPFDEDDVRGICGIGESTKAGELTSIGRFGIGFKSVYRFTSRPEVHSGDEAFAIEKFVQPQAVAPVRRDELETLFSIPIDGENAIDKFDDIAEGLAGLDVASFLFLRQIEALNWEVDGCDSGQYLRDEVSIDDIARRVTVYGQVNDLIGEHEEISEEWLVFSREVEHDGKFAGQVEIAFLLNPDSGHVRQIDESKLVVYFPTVKETHLEFLVQGPYRTTPNRDNVPESDDWNLHLVSETALLLTDALIWFRDREMVDADLLRCLPISRIPDSMFDPLFESTKEVVRREAVLPKFGGGYLPAKRATLGDSEAVRELLSDAQLSDLYGDESSWLSGEFTVDRNPELRRYLMSELGVSEVTPASIVGRLNREFLTRQTDEWIARLYEFLGARRALHLQCRRMPLIRLEDGSHVTAMATGEPQAYLPTERETGFPTVSRKVCASEEPLDFLRSLGLNEPDLVDGVIENLLPKYAAGNASVGIEYYELDVERILDVYRSTDSSTQRERLRRELSNTPWVMSTDAGHGRRSLIKPVEALLPIDSLKDLFSGVSGIRFVDDEIAGFQRDDARVLLTDCGASSNLRAVRFRNDSRFDDDELANMRRDAYGEIRISSEDIPKDWNLVGLTEVLAALEQLAPQHQKRKSSTLWNLLRDLDRQYFEGEYEWFYYAARSCKFDSSFLELLNHTPWVPTPDGLLKRPDEVEFDVLDWQADEFLQSKLRFKSSEIDSVADRIGAPASFLRKVISSIESGELTEEEWDKRYPQSTVAADTAKKGTDEPVAFEKSMRDAMTPTPSEAGSRPLMMPTGGPKTAESAVEDTRRAVREGRTGKRVSRAVSRFEPSAQSRKLSARFKEMLLGDYDHRCQICGSTFQTRSGGLQTFADHVVDPSESDGTNHFGNLMSLCGWHFALISYGEWVPLDPLTEEPIQAARDENGVDGILNLLMRAPKETDNYGNEFYTLPVRFWNIYRTWRPDAAHVDEEIRFTIPHREYLAALLKA